MKSVKDTVSYSVSTSVRKYIGESVSNSVRASAYTPTSSELFTVIWLFSKCLIWDSVADYISKLNKIGNTHEIS